MPGARVTMDEQQTGGEGTAGETIARQAAEIERLRQRIAASGSTEALRSALIAAGAAATIAPPFTHIQLLEMIVETAMRAIGAQAAALCLILEGTDEMVFEVAFGQRAE